MDFLLKLAEEGNVAEARRWWVGKAVDDFNYFIRNGFKEKAPQDERSATKAMQTLGKSIAARILKEVKDSGKAAAILLLTALDVAYIEVLAVSLRLI